jgi:hypothetical protein
MRTLFLALCFSALATACSASHSEDAATAPLSLPLTLGSVTSISGEHVIVVRHENALCLSSPTDLVCLSDAQVAAALAGERVSPLK